MVTAKRRSKPSDESGAASAPDRDAGLLGAVPFACAMFAEDGALVAGNARYREEFGELAEHGEREALLARLQGEAGDGERPREVLAPHSGRWYALHWGRAEHGGDHVDVLTAIDISERIETLDSHKTRQEKLLFTSRLMSVGEITALACSAWVRAACRARSTWTGPPACSTRRRLPLR